MKSTPKSQKNKQVKKFPKEITITNSMVGLKARIMNCARDVEEGEFIVNLKIKELSEDGLEEFGLEEDDCRS